MTPQTLMRMAIDKAKEGVRRHQSPFGAVIVRGDVVLACEHNRVWESTDITAHAEVTAIRRACQVVGGIDLGGCEIYSTCEPCPMCFAACHWARLEKITFGASIADARACGFNEMPIPNTEMKRLGQSAVQIVPGFLREETIEIFREFLARADRQAY